MGFTMASSLGLLAGGLTGVSSLLSAEQQRNSQRAQAASLNAQADSVRQKSELEGKQFDQKKQALRREFEAKQGTNRSLLAAGNVDMSSGSAAQVSEGNINRFSADIENNAYNKALNEWQNEVQAQNLESQASYLKKSSGNLFTSILQAGLNGLSAGLGVYSMAGGRLFGESLLAEQSEQSIVNKALAEMKAAKMK